MTTLTIDTFKRMLNRALNRMREHQDEFSRLDAVLGDGDHGMAVVTAMTAAVETAENGTEFKSMLGDIGMNVMLQTSGSTSTLLGAFFLGMSDHSEGTILDTAAVKKMFAGGLLNIRTQTRAKQGDKTMMDALIPAIETITSDSSDNLQDLFNAAATAAHSGAEATAGMKAVFGRARNYGDRSIGHADAGAMSWACMIAAFAEVLND